MNPVGVLSYKMLNKCLKNKKVEHPVYIHVFMGIVNGHQQGRCDPTLFKNQQKSSAHQAIPFCIKLINSNQFL